MGRSRYEIFEEQYPYFLTCTIVGWIPVFKKPDLAQIILDSLEFLTTKERIELYGYVIMEDHLHLLTTSQNLIKEIGDFKSFTARSIIDYCGSHNQFSLLESFENLRKEHKRDRHYQVWQEGSHAERIVSTEMMRQKLDYIHQNPVRRGYVDVPAHWRYSSARNYEGQHGLIKISTQWY